MNILFITAAAKYHAYQKMYARYFRKKSVGYHHATRIRSSIEATLAKRGLTSDNTLVYARAAGPKSSTSYRFLEQEGFSIINPRFATELTSDKYEAQAFAKRHGLPVADTFKCNKTAIDEIYGIVQKYEHGVVIKPIHSQGQGKYCHKLNRQTTKPTLRKLLEQVPGDEVVVQQRVRYRRLVRTIVVGGNMLVDATTYDFPRKGQWKASVCLNPKIKKYPSPNAKLIALAELVAHEFRCPISFIDFFEDHDGNFILNELNTACSLRIHERITGVKIHRHISDFLIRQAQSLSDSNAIRKKV